MGRLVATWTKQLFGPLSPRDAVVELLSGIAHATPFNAPEWVECAASMLHPGRSLAVLVLADGERLKGWIPLTVGLEWIHGIPAATLRMVGFPLADRLALPIVPGYGRLYDAFVESLLDRGNTWDVAILSELHDPMEHERLQESLNRVTTHVATWRRCSRSPVLRLAFDSESALRESYGKTLRTRLARARRKLAAAGEMAFERRLPAPDEVPDLIELFRRIEAASWKGVKGLGLFGTPARAAFMTAVSTRFASRGWLDVGLLRLDGNSISYRLGFRHANVFYDYNLAYDPAYAAYSPGRLLLDEMIVSSLAEGLDAVDASRSSQAEPHLLADWTTFAVEHSELWLFGCGARGRALRWLRARLRPAVQGMRARVTQRASPGDRHDD